MVVYGDSLIVIQQIHKIKEISENELSPLIFRINAQIQKFESREFYHIKRQKK